MNKKKYTFRCPKCGCTHLNKESSVTVDNDVISVTFCDRGNNNPELCGADIGVDTVDWSTKSLIRYRCGSCLSEWDSLWNVMKCGGLVAVPETTPLDICNRALAKLGEDPITEISEIGPLTQRLCTRFYDHIRTGLMKGESGVVWPFCRSVARLSSVKRSEHSQFTGAYEFLLPTRTIHVLDVIDTPSKKRLRSTVRYGDINTMDVCSSEVTVWYVQDNKETNKYPDDFVEALVLKLAIALCSSLLGSKSQEKEKELQDELDKVLEKRIAATKLLAHEWDGDTIYPV